MRRKRNISKYLININNLINIQLISYFLIISIFILFNSFSVFAIPMLKDNNNRKDELTFQKDLIKNENLLKTTNNVGIFSELIENLSKSEFVQIFIKMLKQIDETLNLKNQKQIERRSTTTTINNNNKFIKEKNIIIQQNNISQQQLFPFPPMPRSPTLKRKLNNEEIIIFPEEISESIDSKPIIIKKEQKISSSSQSSSSLPSSSSFVSQSTELNGMSTILHEAFNNKEWKNALFGKSGLLTEIFNFVNDKRKEEIAKQSKLNIEPSLINFNNNNNNNNDFTKIINLLLSNSPQNGNFEEQQFPDLPFLGICNRFSCSDIYKALDQFKKSEFFSNFQTAISLLNDPKGFDMIGELLANPELLENFTGPENISQLFGENKKEEKKLIEIAENKDNENIGIDFSEINEEYKPSKILFSIDEKSEDYYSNLDEEKEKSKNKKENKKIEEKKKMIEELPEILESIDARPISLKEEDELFPEEQIITFEKNELINNNQTNNNNKILKQKNNQKQKNILIFSKKVKEFNNKINNETEEILKIRKKEKNEQKTTTLESTITQRNFRRDDDYYSMYYDNIEDNEKIKINVKNGNNRNKN